MGQEPGSRAGEHIEWHTVANQAQSVIDDITRIRLHPLVPKSIPIYGYLYDVKSGELQEAPGAAGAGAAAWALRRRLVLGRSSV